jgi:rRNA maturation RNase YbeY
LAKLDLHINNHSRFPIHSERLFAAVEKVLSARADAVQVSLLIVGKTEMAEFNLKYHDTEGPTDVLSFPYTDPESLPEEAVEFVTPPDAGTILGDIIVCYEVAEEIAAAEGKTVDEIVEFYVLHGLEHLLGHHHD